MDKVKKTVWVAVDKDMEFTEHESMESALGASPFVLFLEREGVWKNGPYDNYAYEIVFHNKDGLKVDGVALNSWRICNLQITSEGLSNNFSKSRIHFNVVDPWGVSEVRHFGYKRSGIISALVFLKAASQFYSWIEYNNSIPSEKEKSEIQLLKDEVQRLTNENKEMLERLEKIQRLASNVQTDQSFDINLFMYVLENQPPIVF